MIFSWNLVYGLEEAADKVPKIHEKHEWDSFQSEYGTNWYEYINTNEEIIYPLIDEWWKTIPHEEKMRLLKDQLIIAENKASYLREIIKSNGEV